MTIRDLQCFLLACEKRSISAAAEASFLTHQGASKALRKMEEEIGAKLLTRTKQGIVPTEYGERLLVAARDIVASYESAASAIHDMVQQNAGFLRLASAFGILRFLSPEFIRTFEAHHPDLHLDYMEYPDIYIGKDVKEGKYDIGMVPVCKQDPALDYTPLFSKEIFFIAHPGSRFYGRETVSIREVFAEPLIIENQNFVIHCILTQLCQQEGVEPDFYFKTSGFSLCYKFCKERTANTVSMDFIFHDMGDETLRRIPFDEHPMWDVALIRRAAGTMTKPLRAFYDDAATWCQMLA